MKRVFRLPSTRRRLEDELEAELRFHLEGRIEELMEREHLTRAQAEEEARRKFGDYEAYRREARHIDDRTMRERNRMELFDAINREIRHSARVLLKTPAFSLIAFITLAVGIGATTAIYTVLDAVALRPLAYREPDRLVFVAHPTTVPGNGEGKWGLSAGGYFYFRKNNRTLEDLGVYRTNSMIVLGDQSAEEVRGARVSASLFTTLKAKAALGRLITAEDDAALPGADWKEGTGPKVAVLSYEYWRRQYGGDRNVIGKMLQTSSGPREIIGVAEPGLTLPKPGPWASTADLASFGVDVWTPLQLDPNGRPQNSHQYSAVARLKPNVTPQQAYADLARIMLDFPSKLPTAYSDRFIKQFNFRVQAVPLRDEVLGPTLAKALWILFGAVAVVLFIACANVANLFLVRMEARRRESAIRTALGADRRHMAVHFLSESMLLVMVSGLAGIALARVGLGAILRIAPTSIPRLGSVGLTTNAIVFALLLSFVAALIFGLIPIARTRVDVDTLREGGRGLTASPGQRLARNGLVVGQIALALLLLASAGLMLRSFANLRNVKPGLDATNVLTFETILPYSDFQNSEGITAFQHQFRDRVAALPGVKSVGSTSSLPLQDYGSGCTGVGREGRPYAADEKPPCVATPAVMPGFFESLGIQVRGRSFDWTDVDPANKAYTTAVVTKALANRLWPGEDPIGKGISVGGARNPNEYWHVVGVIPELRAQGLDQPPTEIVFTPQVGSDMIWTVKVSRGDPIDLMPQIRRLLNEQNARTPIVNPRSMSDVVARSTSRASFVMTLLLIAGAMALLLSAVGIYGVISYLVTQRRSEIGVRVALGARMPQITRLVLGQSMRLAGLGVAIGLLVAFASMRVLQSLLFDVSPTDPVVLVGTCIVLIGIAAAASIAPTLRAARIDPVEAMRNT
jgi:putative ABC transport system permease protein